MVSEKSFPFLMVWSVQCYLGLLSISVQRCDAEGLRLGLVTQPLCLGRFLEAPREVSTVEALSWASVIWIPRYKCGIISRRMRLLVSLGFGKCSSDL